MSRCTATCPGEHLDLCGGGYCVIDAGHSGAHEWHHRTDSARGSAPWDRPDGCFGHCDPEGWYATCRDACDVPPPGWRCTRKPGHSGPCAAVPEPSDSESSS